MERKLIVFIVLFFIGCEPGYRIYIRNNTSKNIYFKTAPSIESLYNKSTQYYDSIVAHRINQDSIYSIYKIYPNSSFLLWGGIGGRPPANEIPFEYIKVMSGNDTLILDNKEKILGYMKAGGKKFNYYIEVKR